MNKTNSFKVILPLVLTFLILNSCNAGVKEENQNGSLKIRAQSYKGLVMAGYQGWFNAEGDGAERGWNHYRKNQKLEPGNCKFDFWPEMAEYPVQYKSPFFFAGGQQATLFSSYDESTVDLHFKWMKEFGIDGVFVQRFVTNLKNPVSYRHNQKVLHSAFLSAEKNDPEYGGFSVMLGVPTYWRTLSKDTQKDTLLHKIIRKVDIVQPWFVGRFNEESYSGFKILIDEDLKWCRQNAVDYVPVVFPGFSWHNMYPEYPTNQIPRNKGSFFWKQMAGALTTGVEMIYVAMFDEIDEGTAIFKCSHEVPVGESVFVPIEKEIPTDYYLWLTGQAGRMLRKEIPVSVEIPKK
jgi:hypothetical protein